MDLQIKNCSTRLLANTTDHKYQNKGIFIAVTFSSHGSPRRCSSRNSHHAGDVGYT